MSFKSMLCVQVENHRFYPQKREKKNHYLGGQCDLLWSLNTSLMRGAVVPCSFKRKCLGWHGCRWRLLTSENHLKTSPEVCSHQLSCLQGIISLLKCPHTWLCWGSHQAECWNMNTLEGFQVQASRSRSSLVLLDHVLQEKIIFVDDWGFLGDKL